MRLSKKLLPLLSFVVAYSCATPYKSTGILGGYSSTQYSENEFVVRFNGNGFTSSERSEDFCVLRCAELAEKHRYKYFAIVKSESKVNTTTRYNATSKVDSYGNIDTDINTYTITKPSDNNRVVMFNKKPENLKVYETHFIILSIKDKYDLWGK